MISNDGTARNDGHAVLRTQGLTRHFGGLAAVSGVTRAAGPIDLTVREFELLEYLLRHHGQVVSREALARDVWQETARTTPLDNVIDVHIARLRRKDDVEPAAKLTHTVRGVGFMLREGEPSSIRSAGGTRTTSGCGSRCGTSWRWWRCSPSMRPRCTHS